jgi:hypothetical protein
LIQASGEILDGTAGGGLFGSNDIIAGDDLSKAIRQAAADKDVKAIILRIDSPGGSVSASDQILDAVKKAQAAGKKVVVSMGAVAASGGYYIAMSADRIVADTLGENGRIRHAVKRKESNVGKNELRRTSQSVGISIFQLRKIVQREWISTLALGQTHAVGEVTKGCSNDDG